MTKTLEVIWCFHAGIQRLTRGKAVADESMQIVVSDPKILLCGANEPGETLEYHDPQVHAEFIEATAGNSACWRQQGWHALNSQQTPSADVDRQHER